MQCVVYVYNQCTVQCTAYSDEGYYFYHIVNFVIILIIVLKCLCIAYYAMNYILHVLLYSISLFYLFHIY